MTKDKIWQMFHLRLISFCRFAEGGDCYFNIKMDLDNHVQDCADDKCPIKIFFDDAVSRLGKEKI